MNYDQHLTTAYTALLETKGEDLVILDLKELTVITDYFVLVTGRNPNHLKALADAVQEKLTIQDLIPSRKEGDEKNRWILLDYGFMVIHLLGQDEREFYRLEELWHGAKRLTPTIA
ncbi:MAG TPA: ribosome silencing factor [Firmicutes bacterium]|nr:ribosome silencing factor [Bacillota bacterium]